MFNMHVDCFINHTTIAVPVYLAGPPAAATSASAAAAAAAGSLNKVADDDFLMYTYKVRRCSKTRSHDWTECPYAHRGEKARRRDPRKYPYHGIACPEFRQSGECRRGQNCEYAHGVFEYWLHPTRYRTRLCAAGAFCPRKICFFAHSTAQLRPEAATACVRCQLKGNAGRPEAGTATDAAAAASSSLSKKVGGDEECVDLPDIEWVVDLVK